MVKRFSTHLSNKMYNKFDDLAKLIGKSKTETLYDMLEFVTSSKYSTDFRIFTTQTKMKINYRSKNRFFTSVHQ